MPLCVVTWNLFHGRTQPATRRDLLPEFSAALGSVEWDVCALQEVPPWWPAALGQRLGASVRVTRTSLLRASLPRLQRVVHQRDPELIGVRGAAVNALLVRPSAGEITAHRSARLRRVPQRRTMHAVALRQPGGKVLWIVNLHTHNKPESKAARDTRLALGLARSWAADRPGTAAHHEDAILVAGDFNLQVPQGLVRLDGFRHFHGRHVDHLVGRGVQLVPGSEFSQRMRLPGSDVAMSDHRMVGASVQLT